MFPSPMVASDPPLPQRGGGGRWPGLYGKLEEGEPSPPPPLLEVFSCGTERRRRKRDPQGSGLDCGASNPPSHLLNRKGGGSVPLPQPPLLAFPTKHGGPSRTPFPSPPPPERGSQTHPLPIPACRWGGDAVRPVVGRRDPRASAVHSHRNAFFFTCHSTDAPREHQHRYFLETRKRSSFNLKSRGGSDHPCCRILFWSQGCAQLPGL